VGKLGEAEQLLAAVVGAGVMKLAVAGGREAAEGARRFRHHCSLRFRRFRFGFRFGFG
jgi:hypothetical protein